MTVYIGQESDSESGVISLEVFSSREKLEEWMEERKKEIDFDWERFEESGEEEIPLIGQFGWISSDTYGWNRLDGWERKVK